MTSTALQPTSPPEFGTKRKERRTWSDVLNESVHTSDDQDIGDVEAVSRNFMAVKRGYVNIHRYYIPIHRVEGWDGNVVWLKVPEEYVKGNYGRDAVPDPMRYSIKDVLGYTEYPEVQVILPRCARPTYTKYIPPEDSRTYSCELCPTAFDTEDELSRHVSTSH